MSESPEAREWHRIIRASVRECLETWQLQAKAGPVTVEALEAILGPRHGPDPAPSRGATARVGYGSPPESAPHDARGVRGGDGGHPESRVSSMIGSE